MKLFKPQLLGELLLKNGVVMAPLTRSRAIDNIPNELMKTYYSQRSGAGLIITEGTSPSVNGIGYPRIPGAYSDAQVQGWKEIAEGIHENGSRVFVQLMHTGRVTASLNLPEGGEIMAPSSVQLDGEMYTDIKGMVAHDIPREMTLEDIESTQNEYVQSAINLVEAGVDGVELHSANGYLMDQFLNPNSNHRTDIYGGDYKNRARFVLETAEKTAAAIGGNKVGIRFSPYGVFNGMLGDYDDMVATYTYLAKELAKLNIAYIHIADQQVAMGAPAFATDIKKTIKESFGGTLIVGGNVHSTDQAETLLKEGYDLIYIGRPFISNPNLVDKLKSGVELVQPDFDKAYTSGPEGYIDYV